MTAEQKDRMRHEVEVQKARELKRIADALEIISGLKFPKELGFDFEHHEPLPDDMLKVIGKRPLVSPIDDAKE